MRFAYLLPLGACAHHCCTSEGLVILQDHTNRGCGVATTMYRREQGPRRFGQKLDREDDGEHPREPCQKIRWRSTCTWGKPKAIHGVTRSGAWPLRGIPCEGLQRGLGGSLHISRYLGKNTRVIDGSLHISTLLFSFRIYIDCFTLSCGRDSNTQAKS